MQKNRVTILACANAPGSHKLPLMLVGKAANPRCFKNVNKAALPVSYYSQRNTWVDTQVFSDWFHQHFVPAVTRYMCDKDLPVKAVLLMDNAPAHPEASGLVSKEGGIKAMYLPPNTTALTQPMDHGVLEAMKRRYRIGMLQKLLLENQEGRSIVDCLKKIDLKSIVYMSAAAWDDIIVSTIANSWHRLLINSVHGDAASSSDPAGDHSMCKALLSQLDSNLLHEDIDSWLKEDENDPGYQLFSDDDIIHQITDHPDGTIDDEEEEEEPDTPQKIPTNGEVADMLDKCLLWYEQQEESTAPLLLKLKSIRDLAATKHCSNLKQMTSHSYFTAS